ncbi:MAG: 4Fe-4S dicluster domain-containing protein [Desulfuromonadales bacterium]
MRDQVFPCTPLTEHHHDLLMSRIAEERQVLGPVPAGAGRWRIAPLASAQSGRAVIPRIPLKKYLIPHQETLWDFQDGRYRQAEGAPMLVVLGVALCDLQALWYLDRAFAEDAPYRQRRQRLLVVGADCEPGSDCRCEKDRLPVAGDLFLDGNKAWALSDLGLALLASVTGTPRQEASLPWPEHRQQSQSIGAAEFAHHRDATLWAVEGRRCLSCGACSAVCPTCTCFDLVDVASLAETVSRQRVWDNCFFAEHGQIAGGFDFRPDRAARLRFRFEHKRLGFGDLRGLDSCVGCGRCRSACPVDIDLDQIAAQLVVEEPDAG